MKAKKFLKQQAELDKREILEASDKQSLYALLDQIEQPEQSAQPEKAEQPKPSFVKRYSKWLIGAAGIAACAIILTTVLLLYPAKDKIVYNEQNFVISSSTVEEMDNDMQEFDFQIAQSLYSVKIKKTVDSITNDVIYYKASVNKSDNLINFKFTAVCNPNYTYPYFDITNFTHIDLSDLSVYYKKDIIIDEETSLKQASCLAQIQKGSEFIYITEYNEYMMDEEGSFLQIIQEMFI